MSDSKKELKEFSVFTNAIRKESGALEELVDNYSKNGVRDERGMANALIVKRIIDEAIDEEGVIGNRPMIANGSVSYKKVAYADLQSDVLKKILDHCFCIEIDPNLDGTVDINFGIKNMWKLPDDGGSSV